MTIAESFGQWVEKLQEYGLYSESLIEELGQKIQMAPYTMQLRQGGAIMGGLTYTIINKLCVIGVKLNQMMETNVPSLICDYRSLVRVLLIQHLAKAIMFEATTEQWKRNKGELYQFAQNSVIMKLGERTISLCMKHGIVLTEEEMEAILLCDKDDVNTLYASPMVNIVKMANNLTTQSLVREMLMQNNDDSVPD